MVYCLLSTVFCLQNVIKPKLKDLRAVSSEMTEQHRSEHQCKLHKAPDGMEEIPADHRSVSELNVGIIKCIINAPCAYIYCTSQHLTMKKIWRLSNNLIGWQGPELLFEQRRISIERPASALY